ncbi:hypothetical protein OK074_4022 [Actinobacteria bacterium OK074]|nr:hypothetical protein OK074_4022 [Actinobacteria bacterium OK074]
MPAPDANSDSNSPEDPPRDLTWAEEKAALQREREQRHLTQETKNERHVWYFLAYFLFGIHIIAFVMIYAVTHANK